MHDFLGLVLGGAGGVFAVSEALQGGCLGIGVFLEVWQPVRADGAAVLGVLLCPLLVVDLAVAAWAGFRVQGAQQQARGIALPKAA
ncbi:hypothetical protein ACIHCQ_43625 [Streptomyces sp. NPDC052236]|uniref:hypothetical protein n=1 Tax=Streptomyces sp. NPDC052236 TaxID=3365686 RepID=UPI0037CFC8FA